VARLAFWKRPATLPPLFKLEERAEDLRYAHHPRAFLPGHRVDVLRDGAETYPAMLEAIAGARYTIHLETYILRADRTGRRFAAALVERARAGVKVRLLFDAIGSIGLPSAFLAELRAAGVLIGEFHPVSLWWRRYRLLRRDHRKILVIDGKIGFTGGLNLADDYASREDGGEGWHDMHCRVLGPSVAELERLFRRTWMYAGGEPYPLSEAAATESVLTPEGALVAVFGNDGVRKRTPIRRVYLHAIRRAQRSIDITNAYFIPDRGIRRALFNAVRRGVDVRVVVPAESDVWPIQWATRHLYARLLKHGIRVFEWTDRMIHSKTAVVDQAWATIGSSNLDYLSLRVNLEVVAVVLDRAFAARLSSEQRRDEALSREIDLATWARRPWWHRPIEWLFFQLRSFL
jgi:cardiolipin synthase